MSELTASKSDLALISDTTHNIEAVVNDIRKSSRRSIAIISVMLLISLLSAVFLAYYTFVLSNKLKIARNELDNSKGSIQLIAERVENSENFLRQGLISNEKNKYIAKAIDQITISKSNIRNADISIRRASLNIPFSQNAVRNDAKIVRWFSVIGSYKVNKTNLLLAESFARRVSNREVCTSIWITPGNEHYAVTFGSPTDESQTRLNVALLMEKGVVNDSYAQFELDGLPWERVRSYGNCPANWT